MLIITEIFAVLYVFDQKEWFNQMRMFISGVTAVQEYSDIITVSGYDHPSLRQPLGIIFYNDGWT